MNLIRTASNLMRLPLWIAQLGTGAKSFAANPVLGSRRLNGYGLHAARLRLAARMANVRRHALARFISAEDQHAFLENGYVIKENFLPAFEFENLRREVFQSDWDIREMHQGGTITRRVPLDWAYLKDAYPALASFVRSGYCASMINYVASTGGMPTFWLQAILAGHDKGGHDPQTDLHADTFHSTAKAWFFMNDVGPEDGPFAYVPGSHRLTKERLAWEYEQSLHAARHPVTYHARGSFRANSEDLRGMNLPEPQRMTVRANTLVIADTFGFHARTPSKVPTCRVEIYASLRRNPFRPWTGLDFFSLPYLRNRSGSAHIKALNAMRWAGFKMPWKQTDLTRIDMAPR